MPVQPRRIEPDGFPVVDFGDEAEAPERGAAEHVHPLEPLPELSVKLPSKGRRRKRKRKRKGRVRRGEELWGRKQRRSGARRRGWRWPRRIAIGLAAAAAIGLGIWQLKELGRRLSSTGDGSGDGGESPQAELELPDFDLADELARQFVAATTVDEALPLIRPWEGAREALIAYYEVREPIDPLAPLNAMPPEIEGEMAYQVFGLLLPDGSGRLIPVVDGGDRLMVDFKAFVQWSSAPIECLLDGTTAEIEEVRVILRPSTYYNFTFADSERYRAYEASMGRDHEFQLVMYAQRGMEDAERIERAVERLGMHSVTVALRSVDGSHRGRQLLITKLHAIGFVVPDGG